MKDFYIYTIHQEKHIEPTTRHLKLDGEEDKNGDEEK